MGRLLLIALACASCYHPTETDCAVACGPFDSCPDGMTCQDRMCARPHQELISCAASPLRQLAVGGAHACLVLYDRELFCWGANDHGQLGNNGLTDQLTPHSVYMVIEWVSVSAGPTHTCGIRSDGSVWCWGENTDGQLGLGDTTDRMVPTQIGTDTNWLTISAGLKRSCATRSDGTVWCWGAGQTTPAQVDGAAQILVALGDAARCTLGADRSVTCDGSAIGSGGWDSLTVGASHGCAIDGAGGLSCWGDNSDGELGNGGQTSSATPVSVGDGWLQVSAGASRSCAVRPTGTLACWGDNSGGQLGDGTTQSRAMPANLTGDDWILVETGGSSSCGVHSAGNVQCWGANDRGQVGDNTVSPRPTPTDVLTSGDS